MATTIGSITRAATRKPGEPLNILTCPTHERYESGLTKTGHNFYAFRTGQVKDWNRTYAPLPENYTLLNPSRGGNQLPPDVDFDLVLSQNKFGQFQILSQIARQLHLPLVSIEHTLPVPQWTKSQRESLKQMRGELNLFISGYSIEQWGWDPLDPSVRVIHHGIDTDTFSPNDMICDRKPHLLSVVNDWVNRDWCQPAGQKLFTPNGFVNVEDVYVGMQVLTDDGKNHIVTKVFERDYHGDMVSIKIGPKYEYRFTPQHAIRVWRGSQWCYVEASRVCVGDKLRFPVHSQTDFSFRGNEEAWLIGMIVGDGSISQNGCVSVSFHGDKQQVSERVANAMKLFGLNPNISQRPQRRGANAGVVEATSNLFGEWLKCNIGSKWSKRLPDFIINSSKEIRLSALQGLWEADGSFKNGEGHQPRACFSTISPALASQVHSLLHSFGVRCSTSRHKRTTNKSSGQIVPIYRVVANGIDNVERCRKLISDGVINEPYQYVVESVSLESEWSGKVYNCEVSEDHSYVVYPGFVSHNCCGFSLWQNVSKGLPVEVVGATPGLSQPAKSVPDLVMKYRSAQVFLNTSLISPVPTSLLEAMSCGCAVVSTSTCMIPEIIQNGVNGFISNDPAELTMYCKVLLENAELRKKLGEQARQTILNRFSMSKFVATWDKYLREAASAVFTGAK